MAQPVNHCQDHGTGITTCVGHRASCALNRPLSLSGDFGVEGGTITASDIDHLRSQIRDEIGVWNTHSSYNFTLREAGATSAGTNIEDTTVENIRQMSIDVANDNVDGVGGYQQAYMSNDTAYPWNHNDITGADATGYVGGTTYTATITVDSSPISITILGSNATTVSALVTEIDIDLGSAGTATLLPRGIKIESASKGSTSTVSIADTTLFANLVNWEAFGVAVAGSSGTPADTPGTETPFGYTGGTDPIDDLDWTAGIKDLYDVFRQDCICNSDCACNNVCVCHNDCGCNYSDERLKTEIEYL